MNLCHRIAVSVDEKDGCRLELDSHADSPVIRKSDVIIIKSDRRVLVCGFADEIGRTISVPVVDGV